MANAITRVGSRLESHLPVHSTLIACATGMTYWPYVLTAMQRIGK
jgi:hypothetical protein